MITKKHKVKTMKELSEIIGISRPTLSRFFEDSDSVRPATSRKIKERLKDVNYVYNFIATRQNRKNTGLIGIIIPHYNDLFFTSLLEAISNAAVAQGLTTLVQSSRGTEEAEVEAIAKLRSMNVDGAIVAPLGAQSSNFAFEAAIEDFPIVFVDSRPSKSIKGSSFVGTNNAQSISAIIKYLCRTGEEPVFLGMPRMNSNAFEREKTYNITAASLGFEPKIIDNKNFENTWNFEAYGFELMNDYFSREQYIGSTILCANDRIAIGVVRAANKHGLFDLDSSATKRFRVAGHDDHPLSQFISPALTTVKQDSVGIGKTAIELLVKKFHADSEVEPFQLLSAGVLCLRETA